MAHSRICSIPDCDKPKFVRGFCVTHYKRWKRATRVLPPRGTAKLQARKGEARRFFETVVLPYKGSDCLFWPFGLYDDGYAFLRQNSVSRLVCEHVNGPPPTDKHEAAHSCGNGNRGCVGAAHLTWKTKSENQQDRFAHGTHSAGERNWSCKLTEEQAYEIIAMRNSGMTCSQIAPLFGVSSGTVGGIHRGDSWRHLAR